MTVKEARGILEQDALGLTDEEVQEIIDWLNMMADIAIEAVEKKSNELVLIGYSAFKADLNH
jgi:hypothetical protein